MALYVRKIHPGLLRRAVIVVAFPLAAALVAVVGAAACVSGLWQTYAAAWNEAP